MAEKKSDLLPFLGLMAAAVVLSITTKPAVPVSLGRPNPMDFGSVSDHVVALAAEEGTGVKLIRSDEWAEQYPNEYRTYMMNNENDEVTDYIEENPYIKTLYEAAFEHYEGFEEDFEEELEEDLEGGFDLESNDGAGSVLEPLSIPGFEPTPEQELDAELESTAEFPAVSASFFDEEDGFLDEEDGDGEDEDDDEEFIVVGRHSRH